jgi:hypothetical protein
MPEEYKGQTAVLEPELAELDMTPEEVYSMGLPVVRRVYKSVQPVDCIFHDCKSDCKKDCGDDKPRCLTDDWGCPRDNY